MRFKLYGVILIKQTNSTGQRRHSRAKCNRIREEGTAIWWTSKYCLDWLWRRCWQNNFLCRNYQTWNGRSSGHAIVLQSVSSSMNYFLLISCHWCRPFPFSFRFVRAEMKNIGSHLSMDSSKLSSREIFLVFTFSSRWTKSIRRRLGQ